MKKLEPIKKLTPEIYESLIVVQDFHQAVGLAFIGRYFRVPMTMECPTLYYLYVPELDDYKIYAIEQDLIEFNSMRGLAVSVPTEEPTEEVTESPTEAPTEEVTEGPTEEPTEDPTVEAPDTIEESLDDSTKVE